jgi:hypothetical protein
MTTIRGMAAEIIKAKTEDMRKSYPAGPGGIVGDPYARGYLEAADACLQAVDETSCAMPEDLPGRLADRCQEIAAACPAYVKVGPDGTWLPGSPYDQGRVDCALRIRDAFTALCEKPS